MCGEHAARPFAFVLTTGDNFYEPSGTATASNFTRPEACLLRAGIRWRAVWGNHDVAGSSTGTSLGATRRYYAFTEGPARFVVLDANRPTDPAQLAFMRRQLSAARRPALIVAFHQPVVSAGLHRPSRHQQRLWEPLLRSYRVSLVLQGHNHHYERIERGGVTYLTTGGGGRALYPCVRPVAGLRRCVPTHHFLRVRVTGTAIQTAAVEPTGHIVERVKIPLSPRTRSGK
jgi:acid phosphatase